MAQMNADRSSTGAGSFKLILERAVDESGAVTGVEQRWERVRLNFVRKL